MMNEVLSDDRTQAALRQTDAVSSTAREPEQLKGFPDPVPVYSLLPPEEDADAGVEEGRPWWQWWGDDPKKKRRRKRRKRR